MVDRLLEISHKYESKVDSGQGSFRIDVDDYLELLGVAEYSAVLQKELSELEGEE